MMAWVISDTLFVRRCACKIKKEDSVSKRFLPTNVTQQAIRNQTAKTVKVVISLQGAKLVSGKETVDIGHLRGDRALPTTVEWMARATGKAALEVEVKAISEKGGTDTRRITVAFKR